MFPIALAAALVVPSAAQSPPAPPPVGDDSAGALAAYEEALTAYHGGTRTVPLDVKAEFYEWAVRRYFLELFEDGDRRPPGLVQHAAFLPKRAGGEVRLGHGVDTVTWNGALLAAMSYQYAATGDPDALDFVRTLLRGLEFAVEVTGEPGLPARCVMQSDEPVGDLYLRYRRPGMRPVRYRSDAAKGTLNQVAAGLVVCQTLCGEALGEYDRRRAGNLSLALADHLVRHDYKLTEADGDRTEYGNVVPRIGPQSIPFNAQVAYLTVAAGAGLAPPDADADAAARVRRAFADLRSEHHVYYESPGRAVRPQRVGSSPLVKGTNDRHHVLVAGYAAILLEWELARRAGTGADGRFLYEMGRTPVYAARGVRNDRNALMNFLYAGLLTDGNRAAAMLPDLSERAAEYAAARAGVDAGAEHLRRFPLSRRHYAFGDGPEIDDTWVIEERPWDPYVWKANPDRRHPKTGDYTNRWCPAYDYLHAYWAARYWRLPLGG